MSDYGPSFSSGPSPHRRAWCLWLRLKQNHFNNFQQKVKTGKLMPTEFLGNLTVGCGCPGSSGLSLHLDILAPGAPSSPPDSCLAAFSYGKNLPSAVIWWGCCSPCGRALVSAWPPGSVVHSQAGAGGWAPVTKPSPGHTSLRGSCPASG